MALWPGVLPVLALEGLLREPTLVNKTLDLSTGLAYVPGYTVPQGKRWKLVNVTLGAEAISAYPSAYSDGISVLLLASIGGLSGLVVMPPDLWLTAGWTVGAMSTNQGGVNNTAVPFAVHYLEEDAYGL
jgi:hypothetical protein